MDKKWTAAALVSLGRGVIFGVIKEPILKAALSATACADGGQFDLNLSRSKVRGLQLEKTFVRIL